MPLKQKHQETSKMHEAAASKLSGMNAHAKWLRLKDKWQARHTMSLEGSDVPWICWNDGGLGCVACHLANSDGPFAEFGIKDITSMQTCVFTKHEKSEWHKSAVHHVGDIISGRCKLGDTLMLSPSTEEFTTAWHRHHSSTLGDVPEQEASFRKKGRQIQYCLAEACRDQLRQFLRGATSMTLSQDGSKGRQLARFTASNRKLHTRSGVFCMKWSPCQAAHVIVDTTRKFYSSMATRLCGAPPRPGTSQCRADPPGVDKKLMEHMLSITHIWNTDAAPNELLAGQEASRTSSSDVKPLLPNLRFVDRDRAHACRRQTVGERIEWL